MPFTDAQIAAQAALTPAQAVASSQAKATSASQSTGTGNFMYNPTTGEKSEVSPFNANLNTLKQQGFTSNSDPNNSSSSIITSKTADNHLTGTVTPQINDMNSQIAAQSAKLAADKATQDAQGNADLDKKAQKMIEDNKQKIAQQTADAKSAAVSNAGSSNTSTQGASTSIQPFMDSNGQNPNNWYTTTTSDGTSQTVTKATNTDGSTSYVPVDPNQVSEANNQAALDKTNADYQKEADLVTQTITNIANGTIPLNAGEQAQVDGLKQSFQNLIDQQTLQNTQANGVANIRGYQTGAGEYDPSFQVKTIGTIVTAGLNKISDLNIKMASAVATLTDTLKQEDIANVKSAWDVYQQATTNRQDQLEKTITNAQTAIKDAQDARQKVTDSISAVAEKAAENGADAKTLAAINSSTTESGAIAAAGDSLQTATGQLGDYLQYKRDATASGLTPEDYSTWKAADDKKQSDLKVSEAYGTAFATASGKSAGESKGGGSAPTSPVISPSGIVYNAPASIAPYVNFASNGVKYVDMSSFAGTPTEKNQAVQDAQNAGYKVVTNKNTALDIQNITDANAKLDDMQKAFSGITQDSATSRALYGAAITKMAKAFQTNPNVVGADIYQDAALDILKAMSGVQGFRGGASIVQQVKDTFPSATDTTTSANAKINTIRSLISDRENALVGKPSSSDQLLITQKNNENNLTQNLNSIKTTNPKIYSAASTMFTSVNPDTGQPYSAADILQAFPELNISQ